jgi:hypothetical protein
VIPTFHRSSTCRQTMREEQRPVPRRSRSDQLPAVGRAPTRALATRFWPLTASVDDRIPITRPCHLNDRRRTTQPGNLPPVGADRRRCAARCRGRLTVHDLGGRARARDPPPRLRAGTLCHRCRAPTRMHRAAITVRQPPRGQPPRGQPPRRGRTTRSGVYLRSGARPSSLRCAWPRSPDRSRPWRQVRLRTRA